jgi:hypothetical protein
MRVGLFALTLLSFAFMLVAIALYPGGSYANPDARGFDVVNNFACDLVAETTKNGAPNPGARFATAGMLAVFAALFAFWLVVPRLFAELPRLGLAVRALGVSSSLLLPLVPLAPHAWCGGAMHAIAIYVGCVPAILAALLATYALLAQRASRWPHGALAAAVVAVATADGAMYGAHLASSDPIPHWSLPAIQKVGAILLYAWLIATAVAARGRRAVVKRDDRAEDEHAHA